jgi:hypothetical protein
LQNEFGSSPSSLVLEWQQLAETFSQTQTFGNFPLKLFAFLAKSLGICPVS